MDTCPVCGSHRVFRSRTRTRFERLRRELTSKRPYRCHACSWRGWAPEGLLVTADGEVADVPPAPPDLHAIDSALSKAPEEAVAPEPGRRKRRPAARPSHKRHAK
jgi:predicted RNA-binding Zn-ribbon protein involved in translation (DUF1610 family)